MLDAGIRSQLTTVFADLGTAITLVMSPSDHPQQAELHELLADLVATSPQLRLVTAGHAASVPRLTLLRDGSPTGVAFRGVPGGHEFTSLVVAVLHAAGKGRLPDAGILGRIRRLRGPLRLRTFVALECANCPDVVQALNLIALLHDDAQHEMWDGALAQGAITRLGIQGVPAVFAGDDLLHVGKADLAGLLDRLEERYGSAPADAGAAAVHEVDVAVVGGGPAGAAAAIYTARKGLRVAVVASRIGGQVLDTLGIENLIAVPYAEGPKLAAGMRSQLVAAGVQVLDDRAVEGFLDGEVKTVRLKGGESVRAAQLIIATGARWRELGVPGEREHIGRGVAFCPHCDGPFYKGKRVAVIGGGNSGVEAAIDLAGICREVALFEFGEALRADAVLQRKLASLPNVTVITQARTTEVVGDGSRVTALRYEDRPSRELRTRELDGVFVQIGLAPNSALVKDLVEVNRSGEIVVDARGRTSRPGIYAAGDVADLPFKQIIIAMGDGAKTALAAFEDRMRA
jgi:alkyl hydroperoxide reductase subunit F